MQVESVAAQFIEDKEVISKICLDVLVNEFIENHFEQHTDDSVICSFVKEREPNGLSVSESNVLQFQFRNRMKKWVYAINSNKNRRDKRAKKRRLSNGLIKIDPPEADGDSGLEINDHYNEPEYAEEQIAPVSSLQQQKPGKAMS